MNDRRTWLAGALIVLAVGVVAAAAFTFGRAFFPSGLLRDLDAFYCAGKTLDQGASPFFAEPLGACERAPKPAWLFSVGPNLVMPAPLPGYALAGFALLAHLPFVWVGILWTIVSLGALVVAGLLLQRLCGVRTITIICALALSAGYASLALGQVVPIAFGAVVGAAYFCERARYRLAALAGLLAMIEPHIGLPACVALFVWRPATRLTLAAGTALLALVSLLTLGVSGTVTYIVRILPAHALAEVPNIKQLSLTYVAHRFGAPDDVAVRAGDVSYVIMLVVGIWVAGLLSARLASPSLIPALPCAFCLLGGPFVHVIQTSIAIPAALILWQRAPRNRDLFGAAVVLLAVPWTQMFNLGAVFIIAAAVVVAVLTFDLVSPRPIVAAAAGVATLAFISALLLSFGAIPDAAPQLAAHYDPAALAQDSWGLYVRIVASANIFLYDLARIPTWAGLILVAGGAVATLGEHRVTAKAPA